ncbi:MAG: hypothetical protein QOI79_445, partial [Mycobacterium sp.]|nr:hypothetical protein [Mycobacterium sp.]
MRHRLARRLCSNGFRDFATGSQLRAD